MDVSATAPDSTTFRLMYRSRSLMSPASRRAELGELFSIARSNNKKSHITGALLLSNEWFVQTLEGEERSVRALFERIATDDRHAAVELLEAESTPEPVFARWAMAEVAAGEAPDVPLIAHEKGIAKAAPRGDATAEQEAVLKVMREAARG